MGTSKERIKISPLRFRIALAMANRSRASLASHLGVSKITLHRWAHAERGVPVEAVRKIERLLGVESGFLFSCEETRVV